MNNRPHDTLTKRSSKYIYIEAIRIIACLFVIFNHTGDLGFSMFTTRIPGSRSFWFYMLPSIFCKAAVPLFLAISGALLLDKEETLSVIWKKRILRTLIVLFLFSLLYYFSDDEVTIQSFNLLSYLRAITSGAVTSSYWYLYSYLGLLACLPFLRVLVKNLDNRHFYYWFILHFVFNSMLPVITYFTDYKLNSNFSIQWLMENIVIYPCLGYFIHNRLDHSICKKVLIPLWILNVGTIVLSCYCTYHYGVNTVGSFSQQASQAFHSTFVMVNCATLYITFKLFFECVSTPRWLNHIITTIGGCTFGTYLLHEWLLHRYPPFRDFWWSFPWDYNIPVFLATIIVCFIVLLIGTAVTLILKRIPLIKKLF